MKFLREGQGRVMKKIMNQADNVVSDMLTGIAAVNPNVGYDSEGEVIYRKNKTEKVGLVSGGGSGHEPAHAGYVGQGMLDAAVAGGSLDEVAEIAQKVADNVRSFGVSLSSCILPGVGTPGFVIEDGMMELGMGIHGEPGIEKTTMKSAAEIADIMVEKITSDLDYTGKEAAIMVNGLGGTPLMELYILAGEIDKRVRAKGITPVKYMVGNYMTALEMAGASVSMLRLDDELKEYLLAPCDTAAWKEGV